MKRKQKWSIPPTPELLTREFLRDAASRQGRHIRQFGWRPSPGDIAELKRSTGDAIAYRTMLRSWRAGGFRMRAARKLAGRPAHEFRAQSAEARDAAIAS